MTNLNRREVLAAACVAPVALMAKRAGVEHIGRTEPTGVADSNITHVNVLIHGLSAMIVYDGQPKNGVLVVLPDDPDNTHAHLIGSFYDPSQPNTALIDTPVSYTITNIQGANTFPKNDIDATANLIISSSHLNVAPSVFGAQRRIVLPYPNDFYSLRCRYRQDNTPLFSGMDLSIVNAVPQKISLVHVLTYDVISGSSPVFQNATATFQWPLGPDPGTPLSSNCHIYNEPQSYVDICHALRAFRSFNLITKVDNTPLEIDFNIFNEKPNRMPETNCAFTSSIAGIDTSRGDLLSLPERSLGGQVANCVGLLVTS